MAGLNRFLPQYARTSGEQEMDLNDLSDMSTGSWYKAMKGSLDTDKSHPVTDKHGKPVMYKKTNPLTKEVTEHQKYHAVYKYDKGAGKEDVPKMKTWRQKLSQGEKETLNGRIKEGVDSLTVFNENKAAIQAQVLKPKKHKGKAVDHDKMLLTVAEGMSIAAKALRKQVHEHKGHKQK